ncbi:MAG: AEC family transporter [Longimicrobiales bacterium]
MIQIAGIIAPIFGVMAVGYLAVRVGLFGAVTARRLVLFVFNAAIPIMLFYRIATIDFPEEIAWSFLGGYYASAFAAYGLGMLSARFLFQRPIDEQSIYGLGAGFSNTVLLGIPLLVSAFGDEATVPIFLILPVSIILIETGRGREGQAASMRAARLVFEVVANPIIAGILLGLGANLAGLSTLPAPIDAVGRVMATVAIPCSLLALGASLAGYRLEGQLAPASVLAGIKLLVQPMLAWVLVVPVLGLGWPWAPVAVVMAGLPSAAMVYLFGARYETASEVAASAVVLSSAFSVVTLSVLLVLMGA